jgi:hypothetical protein
MIRLYFTDVAALGFGTDPLVEPYIQRHPSELSSMR